MRMRLEDGQKWDNTAAQTHWLKWQQTQWLWNTLDCGWPLRDGLMWLTLTMTKCLTPSHHTHIHPIQPSNPHPFIPLHSQTQTPAFRPFHNTLHPSPFPHCVHATLPQSHIIWLLKKKERRGFDGEWKKRSGTFEWLFWSHTKPLNTSQQSSTQRETKRQRKKIDKEKATKE